jgi:pyrroline-5-carboxylate reductase
MAGLCIIGGGAMGAAFAKGVVSSGAIRPQEVIVADVDEHRLRKLADELGVRVATNNTDAAKGAEIVLVAVKPGIVPPVVEAIASVVSGKQLVISIAAGVSLEAIESRLHDGIGVIRAMPNTPCQIGAGAIGFSPGKAATRDQVDAAKRIFDAVGISVEVPEKLLSAVTGLSGSGPAYVYVMIEALSDAGVRVGLPRGIALKLAAQTVYGAARMVIDGGEHPALLKDQVASPGGTTIAGLDALEKAGFRSALIEAVKAAAKRSEELV